MKSRVPRHNILRVSSISLPSGHDTHRFNTPGRVKCVHTCETARANTHLLIYTRLRGREPFLEYTRNLKPLPLINFSLPIVQLQYIYI